MNEDVEKLAMIIAYRYNGWHLFTPTTDLVRAWNINPQSEKEKFQGAARAVLEGMREPTGEMIDAGEKTLMTYSETDGWTKSLDGQPSKAWRAMIDELLKD